MIAAAKSNRRDRCTCRSRHPSMLSAASNGIACFPTELEDWSYYCARGNRSRLHRFFLAVFRRARSTANSSLAVPGFVTDYQLDTTASTGSLPRVQNLRTRSNGYSRDSLKQRMIALGSPVSEVCHVSVSIASLDDAIAISQRLLNFNPRCTPSRSRKSPNVRSMIAVKDSESRGPNASVERNAVALASPAPTTRFADRRASNFRFRTPSMNTCRSLTYGRRARTLRRKLKGRAQAIRVAWRDEHRRHHRRRDAPLRLARAIARNLISRITHTRVFPYDVIDRLQNLARCCATYWLEDRTWSHSTSSCCSTVTG